MILPLLLALAPPAQHLTGRLVDPAGAPIPGARITAVPRGASFPTTDGRIARTDLDGRFTLDDLPAGGLALHASYLELPWWWKDRPSLKESWLGTWLANVDVPEPTSIVPPVELVWPCHRLEVRVTEATGEPAAAFVRDERGRCLVERLTATRLADGRPDWVDLVPVEAGPLVVFPAEPGNEYVVSWQDVAFPYFERIVAVPPNAFHAALDVTLPPRQPPAVLDVRVVDPLGRPFDRPDITVVSLEYDRRIAGSIEPGFVVGNTARNGAWAIDLPAGRFRIRATSDPLHGCVISWPLARAPYLPAEDVVELLPGRNVVRLRLRPAGHLDLESLAEPHGPDERQQEAFLDGSLLVPDQARETLGGGRLVLVAGERRVLLERFELPSHAGGSSIDWLLPGWTARCLDPVPPGAWTLRVERGETLLHQTAITVEAGRATVVRW